MYGTCNRYVIWDYILLCLKLQLLLLLLPVHNDSITITITITKYPVIVTITITITYYYYPSPAMCIHSCILSSLIPVMGLVGLVSLSGKRKGKV